MKPNRSKPPGARTFEQPRPMIQTTTLWDFPSQHYGLQEQGDKEYRGVTPSYIIWNVLQRYSRPGDTVLDPMCGSGTTLDVCKDLGRTGCGFDLQPTRPDITRSDAKKLPLEGEAVDLIFVDPPYSDHIEYSKDSECLGELSARTPAYYEAMEKVFSECNRVLRVGGYFALYVSDSAEKGKAFCPIGFELFARLSRYFEPVDIVACVRHNRTLKRNHWHAASLEGNYLLRGFNYLFIFQKNPRGDAKLRRHETAGSLSSYFKSYAENLGKSKPATPEGLGSELLSGPKPFMEVAEKRMKRYRKKENKRIGTKTSDRAKTRDRADRSQPPTRSRPNR